MNNILAVSGIWDHTIGHYSGSDSKEGKPHCCKTRFWYFVCEQRARKGVGVICSRHGLLRPGKEQE